MTTSVQPASAGPGGGRGPTGLADVIDTILDRGLVIDAYVRVSLVGIEILTIDARVVVASVDTYLRFAEAANRLDLSQTEQSLPEAVGAVTGAASQDKSADVIQGMVEGGDEEPHELGGSDEAHQRKQPRSAPTKMRFK
jgi:hypothetical protein